MYCGDLLRRLLLQRWAAALERGLQRFSPPYMGVASPVECANCVFVHSVHTAVFSKAPSPVDDGCWVEWVRLSYGRCRTVYVSNSGVFSARNDTCPTTSFFSTLVTRGRLYISKFLATRSYTWQ